MELDIADNLSSTGQYVYGDPFRNFALVTILGAFSLVTILGNFMVVLVVLCRQNLQTPTGFMIFSLAVSDMIVGLIVMPFNIAYEIWQHHWHFGMGLCDFWHSVDVLASTASIWNLCVLAIDRYIAVNDPLNYRERITLKKALFFIGLVWFVSCIISFPAIIWWRSSPELYANGTTCQFTDDVGYLLFSSMVSFYVPLIIIVFAYWRVYRVASAFQRQLKTGRHPGQFSPGVHMRVHRGGCANNGVKFKSMRQQKASVINVSMVLLSTGPDESSGEKLEAAASQKIRQLCHERSPLCEVQSQGRLSNASGVGSSRRPNMRRYSSSVSKRKVQLKPRDSSVDSIRCRKPGRLSKIRARLLLKESKAAKTLGIVVTCFVTCWLPFFITNVLLGACKTCIPDGNKRVVIFTVVTWLGYCNSAINPFIYSLFYKEFGQAFKWLLCHRCNRINKGSLIRSFTSHGSGQGVARIIRGSITLMTDQLDVNLDPDSLEMLCRQR